MAKIQIWSDITKSILTLPKQLKLLQVVWHPSISLEETMQAHEINDEKIDPKWDISEVHTISYMLRHNLIRTPEQLSIKEISTLYAQILKREALVMKRNPLAQTIYTFAYLYDPAIYKGHPFVELLVNSIHTFGKCVYELHKNAYSIKEDDLNLPTFSFARDALSHEEVIQECIKLERQLEGEAKKEQLAETKAVIKGLGSEIKLRRNLHSVCLALGECYDPKREAKIISELSSLKKRLNQIEDSLATNPHWQHNIQGVFSETIHKSIRSHFGPRVVLPISLQDTILQLRNFVTQLELFIPVPAKISLLRDRLLSLSHLEVNIWSKAYIKVSMHKKEFFLFSTFKTEDMICSDINDWREIKPAIKTDEKFLVLLQSSSGVIAEHLWQLVGKPSRWFWEVSKSFHDMNMLIHMASNLQSRYANDRRQLYLCPWFYDYVTNIMIGQMQVGLSDGLYDAVEYPYVLYYLEYLLSVSNQNSRTFISNLDKGVYESFFEQTLKNKKKKKMGDGVKKQLADILFKLGLYCYMKGLQRSLLVLIHRKLLSDPFEETLEIRINHRFAIFSNVLFLRKFNFQDYKQLLQSVPTAEKALLEEAGNSFKEAKKIFTLFDQFDPNQVFQGQRHDSEQLAKICVKGSLAVMSLQMNQLDKKYKIAREYPKYPEIVFM